jgi:phenylacetate-CoA ligase
MNRRSLLTVWYISKYSIFKPAAITKYAQVMRDQYLDPENLEQLNWKRTQALLDYAYRKVPYYRKRFTAMGLHPNDIKTQAHYCQVPLLTRDDLQQNFADMVSEDARARDLQLSTTGGSTGEPVKVYLPKKVVRAAMGWRMLSWWGFTPFVTMASIYRPLSLSVFQKIALGFVQWPSKQFYLDATSFDKNDIIRFIQSFNQIKPKLLHGYVGAVDQLAAYILDNGISVHSPKAIWVTSAPLSKVQEHRIEKAFGAPVYDQYGCCEIYWLAAQCPQRKALHMFADVRRFEILGEDNSPLPVGQFGKIIVTDLENYYFPLIRYQNGDRGRFLPGLCECGVKLPLMDKVYGRTTDMIRLPDGKFLSGEYMTTIFDEYPDAVKSFQVVQRKDFTLEILYVPNTEFENLGNVLNKVKNVLLNKTNGQAQIILQEINEISQSGGKLKFIRSELP